MPLTDNKNKVKFEGYATKVSRQAFTELEKKNAIASGKEQIREKGTS